MAKLVTRRITPAGFLLALLLFLLLPCLAASCDAPDGTRTAVTYTGADLVTGQQKFTGGDRLGVTAEQRDEVESEFDQPGSVRVLAIVTGVLLLLGPGTALLRTSKARVLTAVVAAGAGLALLVVTEALALQDLTGHTQGIAASFSPPDPGGVSSLNDEAAAAVELRFGFWLSAGLLLAVFVLNVFVALRRPPVTAAGE